MKFTDLSAAQRSMLTMLCTGQTFNTAELGRGTNPRLDAKIAATVLMDLRERGIVYSSQKLASQQYAQWRASCYGMDVFQGRPNEVVRSAPCVPATDAHGQQPTGTWVVYQTDAPRWTCVFPSEAEALARAAALTDEQKVEFCVARQVARVKPVTQPTHVIERV
ncbi:putative nucleotidyl transferase [Pseudomonas phage Ep4]|uniref:Nucleotidyl transferase n=1 Tax=Pseudomonas phage Ep4 TaxID=3057492 RepID=A0AAU9E6R4_9CAUD|nr:putative nucleotidyl transferase [Pseudomonas phage Ep4]